jgi:4-amino-4-deoxy-L-arabinose transferase-like glycosyltransferase
MTTRTRTEPEPAAGSAAAGSRVERLAGLVFLIAAVKLGVHLASAGAYGFFRDELYYLACAQHLDWGYVDHPPFSILVLWLTQALAGDSLLAIRMPAALAGAATVFGAGAIARELGGGRWAQGLAALAVLVAPVHLVIDSFFSMNALDVLVWTVAAWLLIRLARTGDQRLWGVLGIALGIGLQNKVSVLWLGAGLAAGLLLLSPGRRALRTRGPWLCAAVTLAIFLPHLLWQAALGWPTAEFMRNATAMKMVPTSPVAFLSAQVIVQHPLTLPIWLAGLGFLLLARSGRYRHVAFLFLVPLLILLLAGNSRPNYLSPAFPFVLAAGAVALERLLTDQRQRWLRGATLVVLLAGGAITAPVALPILPPERYAAYAAALGLTPQQAERTAVGVLPQHLADRFGWPELAEEVARVYHALPDEERRDAAIFGDNYGRAGALDHFGPALGLPAAISGHNNYFFWGPRGHSGDVVIIIGGDVEDHQRVFEKVEVAGRTECRYCMPYENHVPIFVGRRLRAPLAEIWPGTKKFI